MIDQDESAVIESTYRDYSPKDGKADGDLVLMMLFHKRSEKIRDVYTFQLQEFLSDEDSNLKEYLSQGDLFAVLNSPLNPYSKLIGNQSGSLFIAFIQKGTNNNYILKSMKIAPVELHEDYYGNETLLITNPWVKSSPSSTALQQNHPQYGKITREHYGSFTDRIKQKISSRHQSSK